MAELDFIHFITKHRAAHFASDVQLGIGDDCAVVKKDDHTSLLYTMDSLVDGVHFDLDFHALDLLGRKSVAVNISDIAGMGGTPKFALLSISLPHSFTTQNQQDFMSGFFSMCDAFNVTLIGGDTVSGDRLNITVTLIGEGDNTAICTRQGAAAGDGIWVSGLLGESSAGLALLQSGDVHKYPQLVAAHLDPLPQVALGLFLAKTGRVTSMMDISDGVATDLSHICTQSKCGALVHGQCLPISAMMKEAALELGKDPYGLALSGGEDYQLLCTIPKGAGEEIARDIQSELGLSLTNVGEIDNGDSVRLLDGETVRDISFQGYEHT